MWDGAGSATIDPRGRGRGPVVGVGLSLLLHSGFLMLALLLVPQRPLEPSPPAPVDVEIVSPSEFAALNPTPAATPDAQAVSPKAVDATPSSNDTDRSAPPAVPGPQTATHFYAGDLLKQPRMARIRRTLGTLANGERLTQLCGIEGIEQIGRAVPGFAPDAIVSYAMADPVAGGLTLSALGAAVRSRRNWYRLAFTCSAAADALSVTAYAFTLGEPIPEAEWDARGLNAEDSDE